MTTVVHFFKIIFEYYITFCTHFSGWFFPSRIQFCYHVFCYPLSSSNIDITCSVMGRREGEREWDVHKRISFLYPSSVDMRTESPIMLSSIISYRKFHSSVLGKKDNFCFILLQLFLHTSVSFICRIYNLYKASIKIAIHLNA